MTAETAGGRRNGVGRGSRVQRLSAPIGLRPLTEIASDLPAIQTTWTKRPAGATRVAPAAVGYLMVAVAVKPQQSISRTGATVVPVIESPRRTPTVSTASAMTPIPT